MLQTVETPKDLPHLQALQALIRAHTDWFSGVDDFEAIVEMNQTLIGTRA